MQVDPGSMIMRGTNETETLEGSHHLIVELLKGVSTLDAENFVITEFELKLSYVKKDEERIKVMRVSDQETGTDVTMNIGEIEKFLGERRKYKEKKLQLFFLLDKYANPESESFGWQSSNKLLGNLIRDIFSSLCNIYGRDNVINIGGLDYSVNIKELSIYDINDLLDSFDIPYKFQYIGNQWRVKKIERGGN